MARRPVFTPLGTRPHVREVSTEFTLHPGLSLKQEQRSVDSLHRSFLSAHPSARMLEVSGGSPLVLGAELSAFRLEPRTFFYDWLYVGAPDWSTSWSLTRKVIQQVFGCISEKRYYNGPFP